MVDVFHDRCKDCNCRAYYGIPGSNMDYCYKHKKIGMIRDPKIICESKKCKEIAIFGITKQKHCEAHKEIGEHNLVERKCDSCQLPNILNNDNKCYICDPQNGIKVKLAKQNRVLKYLDSNEFEYISSDKIINNGICSKLRPDFLFDCNTHYVVLEVDEYQHRDHKCDCRLGQIYNSAQLIDIKDAVHNCDCDYARMNDIMGDLGMATIFIRYNPDKYKIENKSTDTTFAQRMKVLDLNLRHYINLSDGELHKLGQLSVIYLYYDNYDPSKALPITLI